MSTRNKPLTRDEIRKAFDNEGHRWPPFLSPELLAQALGLKSTKTVYIWIAAGRLDGAFRKRGKHNLIVRDRAVEILFNGSDWT
jgi:hypothetical protein